ncbi:MAG: argininosuccinate lyase [Alphaproteobacteria bacterium]|nr:argininosuccinate lyase [Alphaproteobacteria bacterium]
MWGGRFADKPTDIMQAINVSLPVDRRLWRQDIAGSKAHADMLGRQGIIAAAEAKTIISGLDQIVQEIENGKFPFRDEFEDIHMNIEARLKEIVGDTAGRLHTARSRNDQVATDFRLWVRDACGEIITMITTLQTTLKTLSADHAQSVMPGFTHLQPAQPVTLGRHLQAYDEMLARDASRFADCARRLNESPLGAAALAGTPYPIDRAFTAQQLGFDRPMASTMDAVSARDFANEFLFACAQAGLHLSRLAEEIVIWTTPQFGFMRLADAWSTGSSIMPQKKNPDAAELVRAKTGRLNGNLITLMTVMKALPLTYNKDMQEDKAPVFDSFDTLALCLQATDGMLATATFDTARMRASAEDGYTNATALADWLVMNLNMPFRDAHHVTGRIVKLAESKGSKLHELSLSDMQSIESRINQDVLKVLRN